MNTRMPEADGTHRLGVVTPEDVTALANSLAEEDRGLEHRYDVKRVNDAAGKHDDCRFFVLDPKHDPIARVAVSAYADEARAAGYDALADDLEALVNQTRTREPENLLAVVETTTGDRHYRWTVDPLAENPWRGIAHDKLVNTGGQTFPELGHCRVISEGIES
jgi:hypothetical protein